MGTSINDKNGQTKIYVKNEQLELQQMQIIKKDAINQNFPRVLNIDSTFTVTLMPGLELQNLLPFTSFLAIKKSGVVTEFELTKQSVSVGFDEGWNPQSIFEELKKYTHFDLPQNLVINVQEWYKSYDAARLFFGYVLKVSDSNITIAENNPNIKKYIKEKLAEGVYLLNIPQNSEIKTFIKESGLDFLGKIQQAVRSVSTCTFVELVFAESCHAVRSVSAGTPVKFTALVSRKAVRSVSTRTPVNFTILISGNTVGVAGTVALINVNFRMENKYS